MICAKKLNSVMIGVRDIEKSLAWYARHFGFVRLYDVDGGVLIGAGGVEIVVCQLDDPGNAKNSDTVKDACIRLFGFEVSREDLGKAEAEFGSEDELIWLDHAKYKSCIVSDPDGHSLELYFDK